MSSADPRRGMGASVLGLQSWLRTWPRRYGFAVLVVGIAVLARFALGALFGPLPPFALFVAAIIVVAVLAGFGPGILATLLSAASAAVFFWSSLVVFGGNRSRETVGLILFSCVGAGISALCESYRRHHDRMREFERVVEGVEEGIIVLDRDYRYVLANRAFQGFKKLERDRLIGRSMADFLDPEVFANKVRPKLDQCLQGTTVKYEKRFTYPGTGERDFSVSYFPIAGPRGVERVGCILQDITERKRAEAALRESEDRYRDLIEHSEDLVCTHDLEGKLLSVNPAPARALGYEVNELLQVSMRELIAPEFRDQFDAYLDRIRTKGADQGLLCVITRSGQRRIWEYNNTLRTKGVAESIVRGMAHDVTERKQAEAALRASEKKYRLLFEKNIAGVAISTTDGLILECNDAWARMLGYASAEEIRGRQTSEFYFDISDQKTLLEELGKKGTFLGYEVRMRHKDGSAVWILFDCTVRSQNGDVPVFQATAIDITERKQAEQALRKSEEHFRLLVEQASDGIFLADASGRYLDVNSAGADMLGYAQDEILQLSIADVVAPAEKARVPGEVARFDGGGIVRSDWIFRRKDGTTFPGEVVGRVLPDGRLQGILRDMTERRRTEDLIRQSEERFRVALKDSPVTVFNQDRDLRYTWIYNSQLYWHQEVVGRTDAEILGPKKAAALSELKKRVLFTGTAAREEVAVTLNGKSFVFDMTIEPLFDADRNVVGITGACMDIARLREMTDRLQEATDRLRQEKLYLQSEIQSELGFEEIIGQTPALREVLRKARIVAPTDSTVLLLGETGTGKELVARSVHLLSARRDQAFVKLNCAAVPSGLLESELFGHEKGAFTGAVNKKIGRIELADKGTLFLDEIGELPVELQPKLLRVLQDREFERLGGVQTLHVDVRIIAATNRDLRREISEKKFREDLFYRLNVFPIELPPLRERREDIPMLIQHFVRKHATRMGKQINAISDDTIRALRNWSWPGNIRELENMIERMVIMSKGSILAPPPVELGDADCIEEDRLTDMEREHIIRVLRETNGVLSGIDGAASRLGVKRTTLQSMMKRLGIEADEYRRGTGTYGRQ